MAPSDPDDSPILGSWECSHLVAKDRGIAIADLDVDVAGDIDPAKYEGEIKNSRAGFQEIPVTVTVDADTDDETLQTWLDEVAERCPVADNLRNASELAVAVDRR